MPKFFATCVFVINAPDEDTAREYAEDLVESPDSPECIAAAWIDEIEESEETEEDEPGEAWGEGLDEENDDE